MKSFFRFLFYSLITLVILLSILVAFLPTIVSTDWGKTQMEKTVNYFIPGHIQIRSMQLHWGKGQSFEGFTLQDPQGRHVVGFEKFYTEASLWQLIKKSPRLGFARIKDLNIELHDTPSNISLTGIQGDFYLSKESSVPFTANLKGNTRDGNLDGSFEINLLLNGFSGDSWKEWSHDAQKYFTIEGSKDAKIEAKIVNFPVQFLDRILGSSKLKAILGDKLNVNLNKIPDPEGLAFNLSLLSPQLQGSLKGKIVKDLFSLQEPANFQLDLDTDTLNIFIPSEMKLSSPSILQLTIENLQVSEKNMQALLKGQITQGQNPSEINFNASIEQTVKDFYEGTLSILTPKLKLDKALFKIGINDEKVTIDASFPNLILPYVTSLGQLYINDTKLEVEGIDQNHFQATLFFESSLFEQNQTPSPLLSTPINWKISSQLFKNAEGNFNLPQIIVKAEGKFLNLLLDGRFSSDQVLSLNEPFSLDYTMTPEALNQIDQLFDLKKLPQLQNPTLMNFTLQSSSIDFKQDWLSKLNLKGNITLDQVVMKDQSKIGLVLQKIKMPFVIDSPKNKLDIHLDAQAFTSYEEKSNPLSVDLNVSQWIQNNQIDFNQAIVEFSTHMINIPTTMLSKLIYDKDLTPLLGPTLDIELRTLIDRNQQSDGYWDMHVDSSLLHARARLFIDEAVSLYESKNSPAILRWTITPEGYAFIQNTLQNSPSHLTLVEPFVITLNLSSLHLPLSMREELIQFKAHLSTNELRWKEFPSLAPLKWNGIIESREFSKLIDFNLVTDSKNTFTLNLKGKATEVIYDKHEINGLDQMGIQFDIDAQQVPAEFFQAFNLLQSDQIVKVKALFGDKIDAQAGLKIDRLAGPVQASIVGNNGGLKLNGKLTKGILTLIEAFEWTIKVTPEVGKAVFEKNVPFLNQVVGADNPIKLSISPQGFSCPVNPFDISQLSIANGQIQSGKINFLNKGDIKSLFDYISPLNDKQLTIWLTPIYFKVNQGKMKLDRFDLLIDHHYPLACWGKIDLKTHDYDLVLGLTQQALKKAFGVKGLKDDYILQVPIKGRKGRFELDKPRLVARVSALLAQTKGGDKVKLFGSLLEMVVSDDGEVNAPKPTTSPFPWERT